jgi:hypothetical protein
MTYPAGQTLVYHIRITLRVFSANARKRRALHLGKHPRMTRNGIISRIPSERVA